MATYVHGLRRPVHSSKIDLQMNNAPYDYRKPSTFDTMQSDIQRLVEINASEQQLIIAGMEKYLAEPPDANAEFVLSNLLIQPPP